MIAVTGATGFLGKRLVEFFLGHGQFVLSINRRTGGHKPYVVANLLEDNLYSILTEKPEVIVHCAAAIPNHITGITDKMAYNYTKKIDNTVFTYCKQENIPIIYISSLGVSTFQSAILGGEETYFKAKYEGEKLFSQIHASILRISVPVGMNMLSTNIIHNFLRQAFYQESIQLWGDGSRQQNFIDVHDICKLIYKIVENQHLAPGIYNVCSDTNISMNQLSKIIQDQMKHVRLTFTETEDRGENFTPDTNNSEAKNTWNWSPNPNPIGVVRQVVRELINEHN